YQELKENADAIIADPNSTTESIQQAQYIKGQAILGESEITIIDILTDFQSSANEDESFFARLAATATSNASVLEAADAMNAAGDLDEDEQATVGLTNTLAAIYVLDQYYELDENGAPTGPKEGLTPTESLAGAISGGAHTYASNAANSLGSSLPDDQQEEASNMGDNATDLENLNAAVNDTGGLVDPYQYYDTSEDPAVTKNVDENSSAASINAAIDYIYANGN
ncbi:hypothetical protein ACFL2K_05425, partial [Candidatus Margulisiibacteriota bacterium]